ncbi:hypothetical protein HYH03_000311 [Edaphochlamys debaryana]|uniref:Glucokinase n=1 Tax=Edaphochlamys debaryana TaxID=47281 RepID=A0A835YF84_9CHLO|nr:hypothetical protein HYH03_000311 [Edaphochlamys debaryana]|eukprot:KAG2501812.1 hypothetical protein HYH03_000311 [Edaphochlamys debaryana]
MALLSGRTQLHPTSGHSRPRPASRALVVVRAQIASKQAVVLVGDIGGTNARLSTWLTDLGSTKATQLHAKTYPTSSHETFDDVVTTFLSEPAVRENPPHAAALAIAGAVVQNRCEMTNISWVVDGDALQKHHGFCVRLLNDFEAVGYGIPALEPSDLVVLNDAQPLPEAPKVVMGPGTGLGAAQLMWDTGMKAYRVWPGEGAHATFAPRGWKQKALARYATDLYGHCEIEQVACGSGLELIYEFLLTDETANRPELLGKTQKKTAPQISGAALEGSDPLAVEAVDLMYAIVGAEAGAMALRCLAKGGVYIAGGITPKLLPRVQAGSLLEGFLMRNGRAPFHKILTETPLFVIKNETVGQIGAREFAKRLL